MKKIVRLNYCNFWIESQSR